MISHVHINTGAAAGGAGAATANADSDIMVRGEILGVYLKYNDSPPAATTDVTLATKGTGAPAFTLLSVVNGATDGYFAPQAKVVDSDNAAITNSHAPFVVQDVLNLLVAQANDNDSVEAWVFYRAEGGVNGR